MIFQLGLHELEWPILFMLILLFDRYFKQRFRSFTSVTAVVTTFDVKSSRFHEGQEHLISSDERNGTNTTGVVQDILLLDQLILDLSTFPVNDHPRITLLGHWHGHWHKLLGISTWFQHGVVTFFSLVPFYVLVLLVTGRYSMRLYIAYNCVYVLGMLLVMQIKFVGFQHVQSGKYMAVVGVFFLLQVFVVSAIVKNLTLLVKAKSQVVQSGPSKETSTTKVSSEGVVDNSQPFQGNDAIVLLLGASYLLSRHAINCTWVASESYSSPSVVSAARGVYGNRVIFDDYREVYYWLSQNTPLDAKVMSRWGYGYQITTKGNRTVLVDNNTWNNTHRATVGRTMLSYEHEAYEIMRSLEVDYVLVGFVGVTGYPSDDINEFLLMVRIGGGVPFFFSNKGVDYLVNGEYRVDKGATPKMLTCLMHKLSYHQFGELTTEYDKCMKSPALLKCLKMMENVTFLRKDNQIHLFGLKWKLSPQSGF